MITRPTKPLDPVISVTSSLMRLNHTARTQTRDAFRIVANSREDLIGVLAELRRRPVLGRLRRLREVDRLADHLDVSELGMAHGLGNAEMLHLRLGEGLIDGIDRPAGYPRVVQQL